MPRVCRGRARPVGIRSQANLYNINIAPNIGWRIPSPGKRSCASPQEAQISVVVALSRHMVDTLPAGSDVAFDHAPGFLFLRTRRGAACDAQRNNDRSNEASHPNLSRGLRQGRWRPAALTRNGSCRWRRTKFRRAAGSFPFLVALAPEPGLVALRQRFALSRLSPYPQMVLPANPGPSAVRNDAMANAVADGP